MQEHLRRLQTFHQEGRWGEALEEMYVTMSCAEDLLNESLQILDEALKTHHQPPVNYSSHNLSGKLTFTVISSIIVPPHMWIITPKMDFTFGYFTCSALLKNY